MKVCMCELGAIDAECSEHGVAHREFEKHVDSTPLGVLPRRPMTQPSEHDQSVSSILKMFDDLRRQRNWAAAGMYLSWLCTLLIVIGMVWVYRVP